MADITIENIERQTLVDTIEGLNEHNKYLEEEIECQTAVINGYKEQQKIAKNKARNKNGPRFVKMHIIAIQNLILNSGLSPRLQLLVFQLAALCDWERYVSYKGVQLTIKNIADLFKTDYEHLRKHINELEKRNIVNKTKQGKNTLIQLNSIYFSRN